jgi:Protein of unknown function (DUF1549)/Protein of unknown function (DUF1553)
MRVGRLSSLVGVAIAVALSSPVVAAEQVVATAATSKAAASIAANAAAADKPPAEAANHADAASPVPAINAAIRQAWKDHQLAPSAAATDGEWCRRVYLDVIGRVPTVAELRDFLRDRQRDKRERLVDRLLGPEYRDDYVRNWTTFWTNLLIGRTGGTDRKSLVDRDGMQQYVREALAYNRPFDQMARELVTASGSCRPGDKDFNGAANFLADKMEDNGVQATARTAQIFLGMAVQCTQCHNHPFNEYQQNQFWELNAFFRQTRVERIPLDEDQKQRFVGRVVERDFRGETGDMNKADLFYELRNGQMRVAYPVFIDGTSLASLYQARGEDFGDHGQLADVDRRNDLAKLIVGAREFDRAIANRMWGHFFGHGFTKPVDDIGPHNTPSHPELLDQLGLAFRNSGFDLKQLMRWIALSEAYGLSSQTKGENEKDDPALGAQPMFSHFYLRQMEAEQLYESLLVATGADATVKDPVRRDQVRERWLRQFNTAFGTDDGGEATSFNGTIPQALALMNGQLVQRATGDQRGSMLARVAENPDMNNAAKIQHLYLAAFARRPTRQEITLSNELLAARQGDVGATLQDIWWALLNSNEFILIH